jgi:hypothetical protein
VTVGGNDPLYVNGKPVVPVENEAPLVIGGQVHAPKDTDYINPGSAAARGANLTNIQQAGDIDNALRNRSNYGVGTLRMPDGTLVFENTDGYRNTDLGVAAERQKLINQNTGPVPADPTFIPPS